RPNRAPRHAYGHLGVTFVVVAGHVATTTMAGLPLAWLRYSSGSILAPVLAHTASNAVGFVAGWTSARASGQAARRQEPTLRWRPRARRTHPSMVVPGGARR